MEPVIASRIKLRLLRIFTLRSIQLHDRSKCWITEELPGMAPVQIAYGSRQYHDIHDIARRLKVFEDEASRFHEPTTEDLRLGAMRS